MKRLGIFAVLLGLAGCGPAQVSVKEEWTNSILSYSFIPLYPMREDVYVGDIRIHRLDANRGYGLHSRALARLEGVPEKLSIRDGKAPAYSLTGAGLTNNNGQVRWTQNASANVDIFMQKGSANRLRLMSLPKVNVARVTHADAKASGLLGLWQTVFGVSYDNTESMMVSLTGLETVEIPDHEVASDFEELVKKLLNNEKQRFGICIAALSMGDPGFEKTAISIVTRVGYARGAEFSRLSDTVLGTSAQVDNTDPTKAQSAGGNAKVQTKKHLTLNEIFDRPLAFGVDAIMINPREFYDSWPSESNPKKRRSLRRDCEKLTRHFEASPASPQLTGAPNRTSRASLTGGGKK